MFTSLTSYFTRAPLDTTTKSVRGSKRTNMVYRDELSKNKTPKKVRKRDNCLASKEEDERKNLEKRGYASSVEEKGVIRVKVKMTKREAARLMSKCKEGGVLDFKDVAHEIVLLPLDRVTVVSSDDVYGAVLHSIPEEN